MFIICFMTSCSVCFRSFSLQTCFIASLYMCMSIRDDVAYLRCHARKRHHCRLRLKAVFAQRVSWPCHPPNLCHTVHCIELHYHMMCNRQCSITVVHWICQSKVLINLLTVHHQVPSRTLIVLRIVSTYASFICENLMIFIHTHNHPTVPLFASV